MNKYLFLISDVIKDNECYELYCPHYGDKFLVTRYGKGDDYFDVYGNLYHWVIDVTKDYERLGMICE